MQSKTRNTSNARPRISPTRPGKAYKPAASALLGEHGIKLVQVCKADMPAHPQFA